MIEHKIKELYPFLTRRNKLKIQPNSIKNKKPNSCSMLICIYYHTKSFFWGGFFNDIWHILPDEEVHFRGRKNYKSIGNWNIEGGCRTANLSSFPTGWPASWMPASTRQAGAQQATAQIAQYNFYWTAKQLNSQMHLINVYLLLNIQVFFSQEFRYHH